MGPYKFSLNDVFFTKKRWNISGINYSQNTSYYYYCLKRYNFINLLQIVYYGRSVKVE